MKLAQGGHAAESKAASSTRRVSGLLEQRGERELRMRRGLKSEILGGGLIAAVGIWLKFT